jgi:hypothetical protein
MDLYNKSHKLLTIKKNFVKQAFYTTLFVSILLILISFRYKSFDLTLSLVIGITISFCTSLTLWQWIKYVFRDLNPEISSINDLNATKPGATTKSLLITFMGVGKILILALVFFLIFKYLPIKVYALFAGVAIVQLVILSMVLSIVLVNLLNKAKNDGVAFEDHQNNESDNNINQSESISKMHSHKIVENTL